MRIAFLGVRVLGHLNPMTTLARKLKARGHDVVFISVLDSEPYVRAAQLPFIPYVYEKWRICIHSRDDGSRLSALIDEVLTNPEYRQNANNIKQVIAETNGLEKAADLLEQAFNLA